MDHGRARLGRYALGPLLGEGGAGKVHRAELIGPAGFRMPVALKVLHKGGDALRREARIGGLLRHENLVDVYEIGDDDGQWFCALELCVGSVSDHLPLPPGAVVELGLQVCAALKYAHEELGLVHLDLKPENLLFDEDGVVKVADLGIAHAAGFELGGIRGTRGYMAPEQLRGGEVDARTDIYALGVTLSQLATGARTTSSETLDFSGDLVISSETLDIESLDTLEEPGGSEPGRRPTPEWLASVVDRCLAHDPADRWPDMAALADALRGLPVQGPTLREVLGLQARVPTPEVEDSLRSEADAFVGRALDLAGLREALDTPGVVELIGPPGVGKSRLAMRAARTWREHGGGEALFCDLTQAATADALVAAVARTLRVPLGGGDRTATVGHALAGRGALVLVLDNVEQVVGGAGVVRDLAERAPHARFLVTSRVSLGVGREVRPAPLTEVEAVELLVVRALQRGVDVAGDPGLPELARRLDGLPLALELAAGRLGVLTVRDLLDRLDLSLLRTGADDRHSTLRAALDGSWELLSERDRQALAQLSVFAGGFTVQAAEQVLSTTGVLDALQSLVDGSLVSPVAGERFRLLSSVRAYAAEKLADREAVEVRHGRWAAGVARSMTVGSLRRQRVFRRELHNLMAACDRAVERGDGSVAVDTFEAAWDVLGLEGSAADGVALGSRLVSLPLAPVLGARAHRLLGLAHRASSRMDEALEHFDRALALAREAGDPRQEGIALHRLGAHRRMTGQLDAALEFYGDAARRLASLEAWGPLAEVHSSAGLLHTNRGVPDKAREHLELALELARRSGNRYAEATILGNLGLFHAYLSEEVEAERYYREAYSLNETLGDLRGNGHVLLNLGAMLRGRGRLDDAAQAYRQALEAHRQVGNRRFEAMTLGNLGNIHRYRDELDDAEGYYRDALRIHEEVQNHHSRGLVLANLGTVYRDRGDRAAARRTFEEARRVSEGADHRRLQGWIASLLADMDVQDERLDDAEAHLDRGEALLRRAGDPVLLSELLAVRVHWWLRRGSRSSAQEVFDELVALAPAGNVDAQDAVQRARRRLE